MIISETNAKILMASLILARSTSFAMTKLGLRELAVFNLLGVRFLTAFFLMLPFTFRKLKCISIATLLRGLALGLIATSVMSFEVAGLQTANASTAAFLENTAVIFVPIFEAVIQRRLPKKLEFLSALIAMIGIAFLTLREGAFNPSAGELLCLTAAILYAFAIIITDRLSHQDEPIIIGVLQVFFMGLFSTIFSAVFETPVMPKEIITWEIIFLLAVVCTCFGFTLQPLAQSRLTSEQASLFCAIGPVGGALTGWIFLNEKISFAGLSGMILIIIGVVLPTIVHNLYKTPRV